jgi:hypothetical protein
VERIEYPKISGPFRRHTDPGPLRNQLIWGDWTMPEFGALAGVNWSWTEKVDGTNVRIFWDGHRVAFGGRTDAAQIPTSLLTALDDMFPEELLEQTFNRQEVTLYGEGYGAKIQKAGGNYRPDQSFTLFDVRIDRWWLERDNVTGIAKSLGITAVPERMDIRTVGEALEAVAAGVTSAYGDFPAEGLVGTAPCGLLTRAGGRIQMKVKHTDVYGKLPADWSGRR